MTPQEKLYEAVLHGKVEEIREAIDEGADVNYRYEGGKTALHIAVYKEKRRKIRALLEAGASTSAVDHYRQTPDFYTVNVDLRRLITNCGKEEENNDELYRMRVL